MAKYLPFWVLGQKASNIYLQDDFSGAALTDLTGQALDKAPGGVTWETASSAGNWRYASGGMYAEMYSAVNNAIGMAFADARHADCEVQATIRTKGNGRVEPNGICLRVVDGSNYYRLYVTSDGVAGGLHLSKVVSGVETVLRDMFFTTGTLTTFTLGARLEGSELRCWVLDGNGARVSYRVIDSTYMAQTRFGVIGSAFTTGAHTWATAFVCGALTSWATVSHLLAWLKPGVSKLWGPTLAYPAVSGDQVNVAQDLAGRDAFFPYLTAQHPIYEPGAFVPYVGATGLDAVRANSASSDNYLIRTPGINKTVGATICVVFKQTTNGTHSSYVDLCRFISTAGNNQDRFYIRQFTNNGSVNLNSNWFVCTMSGSVNNETIDLGYSYGPNWHIVVASWDMGAGRLNVWADGGLLAGSPFTRPAWGANGDYGALFSAVLGAYPSDAWIREFRLYDYALSASEAAVVKAEMWPTAA